MNAIRDGTEIKVYDAFLHKETIRSIEGRRYDADDKAWCVPLSEKNISTLVMLEATLDDELQKLVKSEDVETDEKPILPMRIKATPYLHQMRAYNFALQIFGMGGDG